MLYELCSLRRPFQANSMSAICVKILTASPPPLPASCGSDLVQLVQLLLQKDPKLRPSMTEILEIPYVQQYAEQYKALLHPGEEISPETESPFPLFSCPTDFEGGGAITVVQKPNKHDDVDAATRPGLSGLKKKKTVLLDTPLKMGKSRRLADVDCGEELLGEVEYVFAS